MQQLVNVSDTLFPALLRQMYIPCRYCTLAEPNQPDSKKQRTKTPWVFCHATEEWYRKRTDVVGCEIRGSRKECGALQGARGAVGSGDCITGTDGGGGSGRGAPGVVDE